MKMQKYGPVSRFKFLVGVKSATELLVRGDVLDRLELCAVKEKMSSDKTGHPPSRPAGFLNAIAGVKKKRKKLKPTTIRVRNRNNEVHFERLAFDDSNSSENGGGGGEGGIVRVGAAEKHVPTQWELDAENGCTRLKMQHWDSSKLKWRPVKAKDSDSDSDGAKSTPNANGNSNANANSNLEVDPLSIVTYNVWFSARNQHARCHALLREVRDRRPLFACFQEVTPFFLHQLLATDWVRAQYKISDSSNGKTLKSPGSSLVYGVVMLVRANVGIEVEALLLYKLESSMGRHCLVCDAKVPWQGSVVDVTVATVHLESLGFVSTRISQLRRIFEVLDDPSRAKVGIGWVTTKSSSMHSFCVDSTS